MKKLLLAPVLAISLLVSGCSAISSLLPGINAANTLATVDSFIQAAQFANGLVEGAWAIAYPLIPAAYQPAALAAFTKAEGVYSATVQVALDAVSSYIAGTGSPPNWGTVIADVQNAFDAVVGVIHSFGGTVGSPSTRFQMSSQALVSQLDAIAQAQANVHRFHSP